MSTEFLTSLAMKIRARKTLARYALVLLVWPVLAVAGEVQPVDVIRGASEKVLLQLNVEPGIRNDPARLIPVIQEHIAPHMDFTTLSRLTLGKHWRQATPEQRSLLIREFGILLIRSYSTALAAYNNQEIEYLSSSVSNDGRRGTVRTRIVEAGRAPLAVDYSLRQSKKDKDWKIYDVTIEGVSLAINYRSSFAQEIRDHGFDGLIETLVARNTAAAGKIAASQTTAASYVE